MTVIDKETCLKIQSFCKNGKHKYRMNKFGIVWCPRCSTLGVGIYDAPPLTEEDQLYVICK